MSKLKTSKPKSGRTEQIGVKVTPELKAAVEALGSRANLSASEVTHLALLQAVNRWRDEIVVTLQRKLQAAKKAVAK